MRVPHNILNGWKCLKHRQYPDTSSVVKSRTLHVIWVVGL
jgi:hypothetical protein